MDPTQWQQVGEVRRREMLSEADDRRVASQFRQSGSPARLMTRLLLTLRASLPATSPGTRAALPRATTGPLVHPHDLLPCAFAHPPCTLGGTSSTVPQSHVRCRLTIG